MALLEIDGLSRSFGSLKAVSELRFSLERGELVGFLGPNGAGKTTTLRMIAGLLRPDRGTARVQGSDVLQQSLAARRKLGYLPEGAPLYGEMTPRSLLAFVAGIRHMDRERARARADELAQRLDLVPVFGQRIETLSKGFKRRVGLAAALLHDPEVLVLDEPTDGLDPNQRQSVRDLLRDVAVQKAVLVSTHLLEEVEAICGRVVMIAQGRIVADETPEHLLRRSRYRNAVSFFAARADLEKIDRVMQGLSGVAGVEIEARGEALARVTLVSAAEALAAESVASALEASGIGFEALAVERGRFDEVFRQLTGPCGA